MAFSSKEREREYMRQYRARTKAERTAYDKAWRRKHADRLLAKRRDPERRRQKYRTKFMGRYGASETTFDDLLLAQNGRCGVCSRQFPDDDKHPQMDHCHKTGKVRALLCMRCNILLGAANDSQEILDLAKAYLKVHV